MSDVPDKRNNIVRLPRKQRLTTEGTGGAWTDASFQYSGELGHGGGGGGGGTDMLEPRVAKLESDVAHIQRDIAEVRADLKIIGMDVSEIKANLAALMERIGHLVTSKDVSKIKTDVATLTELSKHLATNAKIYTVALSLLALGGSMLAYAPRLQQWAGTAPTPAAVVTPAPATSPALPTR